VGGDVVPESEEGGSREGRGCGARADCGARDIQVSATEKGGWQRERVGHISSLPRPGDKARHIENSWADKK